jgi:predicted O-methyltransferase YrrM
MRGGRRRGPVMLVKGHAFMEFEAIAEAVRGFRNMTPEQGRKIYDHVRSTRPSEILELGTSYGVSAAYMAAALEANGEGRITTVDHVRSNSPQELLDRVHPAVVRRINLVRINDSSYNWWLKDQVAARSDPAGNCAPLYDFCYIDGAHNWTVDGFAVVLAEKLLRPDGWLLLDDLNWTYRSDPHGMRERGVFFPLSASELTTPHIRGVFELIVRPYPAFSDFRVEDDVWAWARKSAAEPRRLSVQVSRPLGTAVVTLLTRAAQYVGVSLNLHRERLRKARRDPEIIQQEIEERAQELARLRWIEEGYERLRGDAEGSASDSAATARKTSREGGSSCGGR